MASYVTAARPDRLTASQQRRSSASKVGLPRDDRPGRVIHSFAALTAPGPGNDARLRQGIADARAADLPCVHLFSRGLGLDIQAATAALTMPHHNGVDVRARPGPTFRSDPPPLVAIAVAKSLMVSAVAWAVAALAAVPTDSS